MPEPNGRISSSGVLRGVMSIGGGGTNNYPDLENLPQINGVELKGNKTTEELGIDIPTKTSDLNNDSGYVNSSIVANPYDATSTYAVGEYVTHDNNLYKCNTAITTAEEWNAEHWTLVDVISAIPTKTSQLDNDSNFASIDDNSTANDKAWSASKIGGDNYRAVQVNGTQVLGKASNTGVLNFYDTTNIVWGYDNVNNRLKAYMQGVPTIDDTVTALDKVWSSKKTSSIKTITDIINHNIYTMLYDGSLNDGNGGYKKGSINLLTGEFINPNAKKSMVDINFTPIELKSNTIIIHIATGYKTRGVILKPDKTYDSYFASWSTGGTVDDLQNKKGYYVLLTIEKVDGSDITDLELSSANEKTLYIESVLGLEDGIIGEITSVNKAFYGKKIVNFGDSLFGNFRDDDATTHKSISKMIEENTGATVYNAGFGGCRMGERLYGSSYWNAFSMYALADSIYSEDWSVQDQALVDGSGTLPDYFSDTVTMLKAIDFSTIDIVTISYGTNDFTGDIPLDNTVTEYQNYEGALKYSIRKLLAKYPSLRIVVLSPAWRFWRTDGDYTYSSDDAQSANSNGDMLTDYVDKCSDVCKEYHIPYVDMYYNLGFNQYSISAYFSDVDSTHPIQVGRWLMADRISGQLIALLCNG